MSLALGDMGSPECHHFPRKPGIPAFAFAFLFVIPKGKSAFDLPRPGAPCPSHLGTWVRLSATTFPGNRESPHLHLPFCLSFPKGNPRLTCQDRVPHVPRTWGHGFA